MWNWSNWGLYLHYDAVSEPERRREDPVGAARADGYDPRRRVRHRRRGGAGIPGAACHHDAPPHGMQCPDGDAVLRVGPARVPAERDAEHPDAVGDGVVEGREHVVIEARVPLRGDLPRNRPAHLVDGKAGQRGPSAGRAVAYAAYRGGVGDPPARGRRRRVCPVAVDVPRRSEVLRRVERPVVGLVALQIVPSTNQFPIKLLNQIYILISSLSLFIKKIEVVLLITYYSVMNWRQRQIGRSLSTTTE